ncbi:hypothetical protein HOK021_40260 [Streptomyces hygroscopicus]|nr:hypothetical protein HOK021_40260 [Streptomyces hygroscopicus]
MLCGFDQFVGFLHHAVEELGIAEFACGSGVQRQYRRTGLAVRCQGRGVAQPAHRGAPDVGLAQFVSVHAQGVAGEGGIVEVGGDAQALGGPVGGGGQSLLGENVPERDTEADPGVGEQAQDLAFGVPVFEARFETGDQRPQFGDGFGGVTALAGDLGEADRGLAELDHCPVIGVSRVGDAQDVRRQWQLLGDAAQGADVAQVFFRSSRAEV